jgi:GT2 family glycosyltransferase/glycosyltransferase involved in cell wall biosynthesis
VKIKNWSVWKGRLLLSFLLLLRWWTGVFGVRRLYEKQVRRYVERTGLFDAGYYLETNPSLAAQGISPLRHYVAKGDWDGRWPMPFFDPRYYRTHAKGKLKRVNALLHYAHIGRHLRISPSPWFDVDYYLRENKDVARAGTEPLRHYLNWGGREGRSPYPQFDGAYYLRANPDVADARVNPLLHYLRVGRLEGRPISPHQADKGWAPAQEAPDQQAAAATLGCHDPERALVDIVVPVFKDKELTLRTLYSVLAASQNTPFELLVIDDHSPEPDLVAELQRLAQEGRITLLHNPANAGFVRTVNRGLGLHPERDVLLLNADTEVFGDWLDRLRAAAYRHARTGTVTPLSNNATVCSYPCFLHDNPYPLEIRYEQLDQLAASANAGLEVEAPTGVGFCLYIRRDCLNAVGVLDEQHFGRGYGEENDFCQRAIAAGWRNVLAADIFVRHWGGASFQGEKADRVGAALRTLDRLHPDYRADVERFIQQDPLAAARRRLDLARLERQVHEENVLVICHCRGGGAERHVQEDTQQLLQQGVGVFYLRPVSGRPSHAWLSHPRCLLLPNLPPFELADSEPLAEVLVRLRISRIHTHGLVDFALDAPKSVAALAQRLGVPLWVDLHDYKVICPRINLTNRAGRYCGEPDAAVCRQCCETERNDFGVLDIQAWRAMHHQVLHRAEKVLVPDQDMAGRLLRYFPDVAFSVSPHEDIDFQHLPNHAPQLAQNAKLRVVVIGAIGRAKGFDVLCACAADAKKRNLPLEFVLLGYGMKDRQLKQLGVRVAGRYYEHEAQGKLQALAPHVVWLPSLWPETYSYTLSLALLCGYPVFAFDIGAIARRLREAQRAEHLIPLPLSYDAQRVNERFLAYRQRCLAP